MFENITRSAIVSKFNTMVADKSVNESTALRTTGGGEDGSENQDEDAKKLDKVLGAIVDAKSGQRHEKKLQQEKAAIVNAAGLAEENNAEKRCAPGAGATSFGSAYARDELSRASFLAKVPEVGRTPPAGGGNGRACGDDGSAGAGGDGGAGGGGDGSEGEGGERKVPALGDDLMEALEVTSFPDLAHITGATQEEVETVCKTGFTDTDVPFTTAISILEEVLDTKLREQRNGLDVDGFVKAGSIHDLVPGIGWELMRDLCDHYYGHIDIFKAGLGNDRGVNHYTEGWRVGERGPTQEQLSQISKALATYLVRGPASPTPGAARDQSNSSNRGSGSSCDGIDLSGDGEELKPSIVGGGKRAPKSSRKSRSRGNKLDEDALLSMMKDSSRMQEDAWQLQVARDAAKDRRRQEDRDEAERVRKEERDEDRSRRQEQWDAERAEREAERRAAAAERAAERQFELDKLQLQLQVAQAQNAPHA